MKLSWHIKRIIKSNSLALYIIESSKRRRYARYAEQYSDREFVEILYQKANEGRLPNLNEPKTFTEKLQWLKLYYREPKIPICSDKVEVKKYLEEKGYAHLLIPTLAIYDSVDELCIDELPDDFILKASHGSGWNVICHNKNKINWKRTKKIMSTWLKQNLYVYGREWNYKEQIPRLIVEPLMDTKPLVDYKFMCFNGRVRAMQVNHDEDGKHYVDFYDGDWNLIPEMGCGVAPCSGKAIPKPAQFDEMKEIAEELSQPFPFVRVDLYNIKGAIYFGEMTFFPGSGFWSISPQQQDLAFGEWLKLPREKL